MEDYLNTMLVVGCSRHTHRRHQSALRSFIVWCEKQKVHELSVITRATLHGYRKYLYDYRQAGGNSLTKGSLNSKLTPLKKFIQWCAREQYIHDDFA